MKVKIDGNTIEVPDEIAKTNASLTNALAALGYQVGGMEIKRDKTAGVVTFAVKPPPKPKVVDRYAEQERLKKERLAATLKWLLPACNEAARLLVERVEARAKFSEVNANALICETILEAEGFYGSEDELAARRGWTNPKARAGRGGISQADMEKRLHGLPFAALVGFWTEAKFWNGFHDYNASLDKNSIALLKQYGIDFDKVAAPFKEADGVAPEKKKARAAGA